MHLPANKLKLVVCFVSVCVNAQKKEQGQKETNF